MGNCLSSNKILAHDDRSHVTPSYKEEEEEEEDTEQTQACSASKSQMENFAMSGGKKKKTVRFRLDEEEEEEEEEGDKGKGIINQGDHCKTGVVRIKLVVTQEELRQFLNMSQLDSNNSSVEQLLSSLELKSRRKVSPVGNTSDNNVNGSWKPVLKSIPEEY